MIKVWIAPEDTTYPEVTLFLTRTDKDGVSTTEEKKLESGATSVTFDDIPLFDDKGRPYTYTADEGDVPGYDTVGETTGSVENGFVITNRTSKQDYAYLTGTKTWITGGQATHPVSVELYRDDTRIASINLSGNVDSALGQITNLAAQTNGTYQVEDDVWSYVFFADDNGTPLSKYDIQDDAVVPYVYTVKEVFDGESTGYHAELSGMNIVNIVNQKVSHTYKYRIDRTYTVINDGVADAPTTVTGETVTSLDPLAVSFDTGEYSTYELTEYSFENGMIVKGIETLDQKITKGANDLNVRFLNDEYVITLNYVVSYETSDTTYSVKHRYYYGPGDEGFVNEVSIPALSAKVGQWLDTSTLEKLPAYDKVAYGFESVTDSFALGESAIENVAVLTYRKSLETTSYKVVRIYYLEDQEEGRTQTQDIPAMDMDVLLLSEIVTAHGESDYLGQSYTYEPSGETTRTLKLDPSQNAIILTYRRELPPVNPKDTTY